MLLFIFNFEYGFTQQIQRFTIGVQGSSNVVSTNETNYLIQQSIGQTSVIGNFQFGKIVLRQGFIQPPIITGSIIKEETSILASLYPNPFNSSITVLFGETMEKTLSIFVYDMLGRNVYQDSRKASQSIQIDLERLASAKYILHITSGNKHFKANLIKR